MYQHKKLLSGYPPRSIWVCACHIQWNSQKFIDKYNLTHDNGDGWKYFQTRKVCYGLPQIGKLANDLLRKRISKHGYYECTTTPGLWCHKWRPITFLLLVGDFGLKYVGERHTSYLQMSLEENYEITMDWWSNKYSGINIIWDYVPAVCANRAVDRCR